MAKGRPEIARIIPFRMPGKKPNPRKGNATWVSAAGARPTSRSSSFKNKMTTYRNIVSNRLLLHQAVDTRVNSCWPLLEFPWPWTGASAEATTWPESNPSVHQLLSADAQWLPSWPSESNQIQTCCMFVVIECAWKCMGSDTLSFFRMLMMIGTATLGKSTQGAASLGRVFSWRVPGSNLASAPHKA